MTVSHNNNHSSIIFYMITMIKQAASESLDTKRRRNRKRALRNWDETITQIISDKRAAYQKYICTRKEEDKINYHLKRAIAKREVESQEVKISPVTQQVHLSVILDRNLF
ncbi:hypothetical protein C0J52_14954 [Blattella germanica]|nr:hypothetical protein C0J52_14954 [Blattella germanica]